VTNKKGPIDFIICIGDDTSDEAMFRQLTKNKDSFAEDYVSILLTIIF
jgi:trehalose-6-phosphatase